jgi:hypothetical protein
MCDFMKQAIESVIMSKAYAVLFEEMISTVKVCWALGTISQASQNARRPNKPIMHRGISTWYGRNTQDHLPGSPYVMVVLIGAWKSPGKGYIIQGTPVQQIHL